jgi:hypothetical protein
LTAFEREMGVFTRSLGGVQAERLAQQVLPRRAVGPKKKG